MDEVLALSKQERHLDLSAQPPPLCLRCPSLSSKLYTDNPLQVFYTLALMQSNSRDL